MILSLFNSFRIALVICDFCGSLQMLGSFSISVKNASRILIGFILNLQMDLSNVDILTMLILLIHECGISFHLFVSLVSFIEVLLFSFYRSFTFLV